MTRNVPSRRQIDWIEVKRDREGLVYTGGDFTLSKFLPYRDMTGLTDLVDFDIVTGHTHREMMKMLTKYDIGLTPWLPHTWHPYSDANRNYEYLHAGLQVIVNSVIKILFRDDPYVHAFRNYSDILTTIDSVKIQEPQSIMDHARRRYVWENQEDIIKEAYNVA
ncbi:MAG: hypothetical protein ACXADF_15880 [Candidatus Thorarchaeota archaeon]